MSNPFETTWHECGYCDGSGFYFRIDDRNGEEYSEDCGVCEGEGGWEDEDEPV
jgi:DnaJ-class molecular chaperone